nr:MAM domain-containing glycosylphosphatidylinositol anchor protein 2-like [Parasteatoda tepidariorum]
MDSYTIRLSTRSSSDENLTDSLKLCHAPLRWLKEPFDVEVTEGSEAHLVCVASGSPQPHYTWTKIEDYNHEKKMIVDGDLVFRETKISDAGTYTCRVQNGVGEPLEKSVKVVVHGYL